MPIDAIPKPSFEEAARSLAETGRAIHARGWVPATSGNFSVRLPDDEIAITASGRDKSRLEADDILRLDSRGRSPEGGRPSAETGLHRQLYQRDPGIGAVLHTHSLAAVLTTLGPEDEIEFRRLELLKAFPGVDSHEAVLGVPVFDNDQDIPRLAGRVDAHMATLGTGVAYLIRGHGLYTWGRNLPESMKHLEALEWLLEYHLRSLE